MNTVKINIPELSAFGVQVQVAMAGSNLTGPIGDAFLQWAEIYRAFLKDRFATYSRGGGDWAPLKPSTIRGRRKGRGWKFAGTIGQMKRNQRKQKAAANRTVRVSILWDTGTLIAALNPVFAPGKGSIQSKITNGIRVGYGGPGTYKKGGASIAKIAMYHQTGSRHMPARRIVVPPTPAVVKKMVALMQNAVLKHWQQIARKSG